MPLNSYEFRGWETDVGYLYSDDGDDRVDGYTQYSLRDKTNTLAINYKYDEKSRLFEAVTTTYSNGGANTGAYYNPFRYRGYYYDTDLGLYYLNSRYYDATTGRFLNADVFISTGQGILSYNMFAYCRNEPVFRKDTRGTSDVCVTHADEDNNPLNDLGGGGGGGRGFSVYYDSSAYGTYSIRTSVASYDANLGGYYYGGGGYCQHWLLLCSGCYIRY